MLIEKTKDEIVQLIRKHKSIKSVAESVGVNRNTVHCWLKKWGITRRSVMFNERFFEKVDNEPKAYWLGFMMADGCVSLTHGHKVMIKLASKDWKHLEKWHESINSCLNVCRSKVGASSQHYSDKMCQDLIRLGCKPRKSLELKFPEINDVLLPHFVRGYFDGDGCASVHNKKQKTPQLRLSFIGTEDFLSKLQGVIGTNCKLVPTGNNKIVKSLGISGNTQTKRITDWMYKDATIFLERKRKVINAALSISL